MKELSIEEKAKAYDEALKAAVVAYEDEDKHLKATLERIFPILKENIDVKSIKALIVWAKSYSASGVTAEDAETMLNWLEKQCQVKESEISQHENKTCKENCNSLTSKDEQNPDKVEPKFHEDDWIVNKGHSYLIADIDYEQRRYLFEIDGYTHEQLNWEYIANADNKYHLWTIQDAKDGDVLVASDDSIFLFAGVVDCACKYYVALTTDGAVKFNKGLEHYWETIMAVHPATKEQRDKLEKAMVDAGYTFDFEKKELKKIEQKPVIKMKTSEESLGIDSDTYNKIVDECIYGDDKPAWSEEDETKIKSIIALLKSPAICTMDGNKGIIDESIKYLKSLKERIHPKQEWSEEDEKFFNTALWHISYSVSNGKRTDEHCATTDWLKSLKERFTWKPSDEQMKAIEHICDGNYNVDLDILDSIYRDLKKLREE